MKTYQAITAVLLAALWTGCSKNYLDDYGPYTDAETNRWIYSVMKDQYLYNGYVKQLKMKASSYEQTCENYFQSILSPLPTDNDGKHANGYNYFYSTLKRDGNGSKSIDFENPSYGFDYMQYTTGEDQQYRVARVAYVVPGSPAAKAGLLRGDWITSIDGKPVASNQTGLFSSGGAAVFHVQRVHTKLGGNWSDVTWEKDVSIGVAEIVDYNPVVADTVIVRGGSRIGYLAYASFDTGPKGPSNNDHTYDNTLKKVFARFNEQQINELVVDLRYNPGGYISSCQLLSSMIVGQEHLGENFCYYRYNADQTAQKGEPLLKFLSQSEVGGSTVAVQRLFVLTGQWTASASELLVSALKPYMPICLIGVRTEGKNVGSYEIRSDEHKITLHPITLQLYNKDRWSDYATGFEPSIRVDDYSNQDQMLPLGDPQEYMLSYAIDAIEKNFSPAAAAGTKAAATPQGPFGTMEGGGSSLARVRGAIAEPVESPEAR